MERNCRHTTATLDIGMHSATLLIAAALLAPSGDAHPRALAHCDVVHVCELATGNVAESTHESERALLTDAADGRLDETSLLEAAIIAGGQRRGAGALAKKFARTSRNLLDKENAGESERDLAQDIFENLHQSVLRGRYQSHCSDCSVALTQGDFNCVTATVLYIQALRDHGIPAHAYAMVGHVFCRVGEAEFDVETTCPRWFQLSRREANAAARRAAAGRDRDRSTARRLSDVELIGKIYYNRGVACFRAKDFEEGMLLTKRSLLLDARDEVAHGNVLAGLNNWGLHLCHREQFAAADKKFVELRRLDPDYPTLAENEEHLYRLWQRQRLEQARGEDAASSPAG